MNKQNKIFQPKVIIGSVMSFIIAVVGVIAVFFPSLFNLEKKSIAEAEFVLSGNENEHKQLWEFLEQNQNRPVTLNIAYCSDFEKMVFKVADELKGIAYTGDGQGNILPSFRVSDSLPDIFAKPNPVFQGKRYVWQYPDELEKLFKDNKMSVYYYEGIGNDTKNEWLGIWAENDGWTRQNYAKNFLTIMDNGDIMKINYIPKASYPPAIAGKLAKILTYNFGQQGAGLVGVNIENGGIGFAFSKPNNKTIYQAYALKDILIPYSTQKNKKYTWVVGYESEMYKHLDKSSSLANKARKICNNAKAVRTDEVDELKEIWGAKSFGYLAGTFFVHSKEKALEEMESPQSDLVNIFWFGELGQWFSYESIELEPLDKKDIELRKY